MIGHRNNILHEYAYQLFGQKQSREEVQKELDRVNATFNDPLPQHEITGILNAIFNRSA